MCSWALSAKAVWLLWLSNEENISLLWAICIAGKAKCNTKLVCLFSTHLPVWKSVIRWSKCKESWFINIPAAFRLKSGQEFLDMGLFLFHSLNFDWSCFSMSSNLLELMSTQILAMIGPDQSSLTCDRKIESTLVQQAFHLLGHLWRNAVYCLGEWSNWLWGKWKVTKSERESEIRGLWGARIGLGCKHKMEITDHHWEVFICSMREKVHEWRIGG